MKGILLILLFAISPLILSASYNKSVYETHIEYEVEGKYKDIMFTLLDEINQNGFILSYRANIANAIEGITTFQKREAIFKHAEKIGFCRLSLSLEMMDENPDNLMFCPLSIALYELNKKDSKVKIIYKLEKSLNKNEKVMEKVNATIIQLIEASLEE